MMHCGYFNTARKKHSLCYSDTNISWWATLLPSEICAQSDPPPSKDANFDRFPLITALALEFLVYSYSLQVIQYL